MGKHYLKVYNKDIRTAPGVTVEFKDVFVHEDLNFKLILRIV